MEYVSKINILGLKMMVKIGLEKIILKFLHAQNIFFYFMKMPKITNAVIKMAVFAHGGISIKLFVMYVHYHKLNFKPQISPIFHFEYVNLFYLFITHSSAIARE